MLMTLFFQVYGQRPNPPSLIILHGLFGSSTNWGIICRHLARHYTVYALDLRNHGRSPHQKSMSYPEMADDVLEFIEQQNLSDIYLLGHSMGGKTAMQLALNYPDIIQKLIVVDIAPKTYPAHHDDIFRAIERIDQTPIESRNQAEQLILELLPAADIRLFLLTNLVRDHNGLYQWRINMPVIRSSYPAILEKPKPRYHNQTFNKPCLFIRGDTSDYILASDTSLIQTQFKAAQIITIENAGHWVHAQQPERFLNIVEAFLTYPPL